VFTNHAIAASIQPLNAAESESFWEALIALSAADDVEGGGE
jgi:hypothetical protein